MPRWRKGAGACGSAPGGVEHHLDDIRVVPLGGMIDRMGDGAHRAVGMRVQQRRTARDQRGWDQRLIALHVDDDLIPVQTQMRAGLGQTVTAADVVASCHQGLHAVLHAGLDDATVVGGDHDLLRATGLRLVRHAHDHRQTRQVEQGLVR
jgi:hypothetical protein